MFELKPLSPDNIESALDKAQRYRLLGEPREAESICLDILAVEPDNQAALIMQLLAITDRFEDSLGGEVDEAKAVLEKIEGAFEQAYYAGIICERRAKLMLTGRTESGPAVFDWLDKAMRWYERADALSPAQNDDARLRWNTCARLINQNPHLRPPPGPPSADLTV